VSDGATGRSEWSAFGTTAVLCTTDAAWHADARTAVEDVLETIDRACNRFDPASELARVNGMSGRRVRISSTLARALGVAIDVAAATDGAVDPTVGCSLEAAGYDRDFWAIQSSCDEADFVPALGWRSVQLDLGDSSVMLPPGVKLDLGSTGKALAVDMAARAAAARADCGVLFSLGGDIAIAGPAPEGGWPVHVTDDHAAGADAPGQTIAISAGGLATSSTLARRWRRRDDVHHILDPSTGRPAAEVWCTASVVARTCTDANAQATAAIVRGREAARRLERVGLPARLRSCGGDVLYVNDWPTTGDSQNVDLVSHAR
jgi:thiamine biosynthesis lipoprotein